MATRGGNTIKKDGLLFYYDINNRERSYKGEPITSVRTSTESLLDIAGGNTIDVSTASFVDGFPIFNGSAQFFKVSSNFVSNVTQLTTDVWFKKTSGGHTYECALHKGTGNTIGSSDYWSGVTNTDYLCATIGANRSGIGWAAGSTTTLAKYGKYYNLVAAWDGSIVKVYINGKFNKQYALTSYGNINSDTRMGASDDGGNYQLSGEVPIVKIYNRALSDKEIFRNYKATKGRFINK